jgi:outer membrane murein-binding lipoprotein Lpp
MTFSIGKKLAVSIVSVTLVIGCIMPAIAKGSAGIAGSDSTAAASASPLASTRKPTRAERKAMRKEARAKKNAELKKLEDSGYQPTEANPDYPQNLETAKSRAATAQPASR